MSKFQLILTGVFAAFIIIGVMAFSLYRGSSKTVSNIVVWGTMPALAFNDVYSQSALSKDLTVSLNYVEKDPATFDAEFINALANGNGPDVVLLPHEEILQNRDKLFPIPFATLSQRNFDSIFAQEADLFVTPQGIVALPLTIDPLVLYWNRDTFNSASIANPPSYWDQLYALSQTLTAKDGAFNITKATVPLGEFNNVDNAKEIISTLLLQAGTPIVTVNGTFWQSALTNTENQTVTPAISALTFYTGFSDPSKPFYSWNRSLPDSGDIFVSGDLALYPGFASELKPLRLKNPNLNFAVAMIPQSRGGGAKITYGRMESLAVVKNSKNIAGAYAAIVSLAGAPTDALFANELGVAPARRDLLALLPADPDQSLFYSSALQAQGWLDPNAMQTSTIFGTMINSITGGTEHLETALNEANLKLQALLNQ